MKQFCGVVLGVLLLSSCGGGGGGGSDTNVAQTPVEAEGQDQVETDPINSQPSITEFSLEENEYRAFLESELVSESMAKTSHEIIVPDNFNLHNQRSLTLRVTRANSDNQDAYLSLCNDYQQHDDGSYSINYESCLLRTSLSNINYETTVTVSNDLTGLVAVLWFLESTKKPIITDWRF